MAKNLSVVLTSGGLNSAVAAALTAQDDSLALLHLQVSKQCQQPEQQAFESLCQRLAPAKQLITSLGDWGCLVDSSVVQPHVDIPDAPSVAQSFMAETFVPMLAPAMLCAAAAWAYTIGARRVVWGINADNLGNYPDRNDTIRLLAWQLISRSLPEDRAPAIDAPLAQYTADAVVQLAENLKVPTQHTWNCLRDGKDPCGHCLSCITTGKALGKAGAKTS